MPGPEQRQADATARPAPFHLLARDGLTAPPDQVARALLGALLVRQWEGQTLVGRIVETEAYFGQDDAAAHAAAGRTARNAVLWGEPGYAYVYFIYGMHACLNVACQPTGQAGCVLVRALEPIRGLGAMGRLRGLAPEAPARLLTSGPGRLCQAMAVTRAGCNGADLLDPQGALLLAEPEPGWTPGAVITTPRIGIRKAAERSLRFFLEGNACVSGPRGHMRHAARTRG